MKSQMKSEAYLCLSLGNTRLSLQLILPGSKKISPPRSFSRNQDPEALKHLQQWWQRAQVKCPGQLQIAICSVLEERDQRVAWPQCTEQLRQWKQTKWVHHYFKSPHFLDLRTHYSPTLGADRYLQAWGIKHLHRELFPQDKKLQAVAVLDVGTMCTLDFVSSNGEHLGGPIFLGLKSWQQALMGASKLKALQFKPAQLRRLAVLPQNTSEALISGHLRAMALFVITQCREMKTKRLVISGGDSALWTKLLEAVKPKQRQVQQVQVLERPHFLQESLLAFAKTVHNKT